MACIQEKIIREHQVLHTVIDKDCGKGKNENILWQMSVKDIEERKKGDWKWVYLFFYQCKCWGVGDGGRTPSIFNWNGKVIVTGI